MTKSNVWEHIVPSKKIEPPHDKTNKVTMCPAKTQISLGICPVWSESSLCTQWVAKDPSFLHADSEDSDQAGWMPRLIWVFAGRTVTLLVLSWGGSIRFLNLLASHNKTCHKLNAELVWLKWTQEAIFNLYKHLMREKTDSLCANCI